MRLHNESGQGLELPVRVGEALITLRMSRGSAVQAYNALVEAWSKASAEERRSMTDPATYIDPYLGITPVAVIDLDAVAKEHKVDAKALVHALRASPIVRAFEADGRLAIRG